MRSIKSVLVTENAAIAVSKAKHIKGVTDKLKGIRLMRIKNYFDKTQETSTAFANLKMIKSKFKVEFCKETEPRRDTGHKLIH